MSDSGRKRSRKTKLVPRDFSDLIDDDSFLQEPPFKIPCFEKRQKDGESSGSLEFSVKVEVEDIDSLPEDDPSSYMKYLFSLSQDSSHKDDDELDKIVDNPDKIFVMDTHKVMKAFRGLQRKYPLEKEAVIHTRNAWGKVFHEKPNEELPRHPKDLELQNILTQWKYWLITSKVKETPLCYKCYICSNAWWTLMDFKDHIRFHEDCSLEFELVQQECNIIAYMGTTPEPQDIPVDGRCLKCAKTFQQHKDCQTEMDRRYSCPNCHEPFLSCRLLVDHEGVCEKNPIRTAVAEDTEQITLTEYKCKICCTVFLSKPELCDHLVICHRVRSDDPISTYSKVCGLCNGTFHIFSYHVCTKKNLIHECKHCHSKFQNKQMLEGHVRMWSKPFKCRICRKCIMRGCMGAAHYATHSNNFVMMYRCLPCQKLKLFYNEDSCRQHRLRNHKRVDNRRPGWDQIIVPRIMLEQCEVKQNVRRRRSNTKKSRNSAPTKAARSDRTIDRRKTNSTDNQEDENTAEENDSIISESSQNAPEDSKDFAKTLELLTETLDIKPDIIVKEEKGSDTEDSKVDLIKTIEEMQEKEAKTKADVPLAVREQSNKFKQIIQEAQEIKLSNVFQVSKNVKAEVKKEIKEEPEEFEDDLIILDSSNESIKQESDSDVNMLKLEPEVILKAGYRKRKTYKCAKCDFEGYHREYKEHVNNHCRTPSNRKPLPTDSNFTCTKCNNTYETLKNYAQHFEEHNYRFMTCPQCVTMFDSITKLVAHINLHIKHQFVSMRLIQRASDAEKIKVCQCKKCKEVVDLKNTFAHWEGHLEIQAEPDRGGGGAPPARERGEGALPPDILKRILDLLQSQDKLECMPKKVKTCLVCQRFFQRQNDCKRHLVEHLLEDAYANVDRTVDLKCQICGEILIKPELYKKHMRDHGSLPIYQCGLCNKTFSDSSNFTKHKKVHNLRAFVCDICNKKFQAKFSLEKHIQMHMVTEPFRCDRCDRLFYDRCFFRRHMRQHHDRPFARFKCMVCKERFESLRLKWDHMWEAHKQRKDKADCPICQKSFRKITDVKKHTASEHGFNMSLVNVFQLVDKYQTEYEKVVALKSEAVEAKADVKDDSDDDVLLIEEERETLVIYDD